MLSLILLSPTQDPVAFLRLNKRRVVVLAYLHTTWSFPYDAVFRGSSVSTHGMVFDLLYLADIALEVTFRDNKYLSTYFRTTEVFNKTLGSCLCVDVMMLVSEKKGDRYRQN